MSNNKDKFLQDLEKDLINSYGYLIANKDLCSILGFKNMPALRQSMKRSHFPVPVFSLENRKGRYALAKDIAAWLTDKRFEAIDKMAEVTNE